MILFFFFFLPLIQILTKRKSNFQRKQSETYNQNDKKQINKLTELLPIYVLPSEKKDISIAPSPTKTKFGNVKITSLQWERI